MGGLSPLARGTRAHRPGRNVDSRFIPAGAGNTFLRLVLAFLAAVYPRWRGEHDFFEVEYGSQPGLSPLARGTRRFQRSRSPCRRFIPAGAGNTFSMPLFMPPNAVYPRWRGEHKSPTFSPLSPAGLSPLARGTRHKDVLRAIRNRFIPAGAGNTKPSTLAISSKTVYPRWRGEHYGSWDVTSGGRGLSPLARGTRGEC